MMRRRNFITLLGGAAAWPLAAQAQQRPRDSVAQSSPRTYRLGTLTGNVPLSANSPDGATLLNVLAQRGYTLGRNLAYDARGAGGELSKIPQLIEDFRASGVDVIMTVGYPAARHAKASGIPTVIVYGSGDPVATGLVTNLAQPGGATSWPMQSLSARIKRVTGSHTAGDYRL
jgi:putative tryptophan/tyrosine transport system substrate-binding protein